MVETQAEPMSRRPRATQLYWRPEAELQACGTQVETGTRQTVADLEGPRTTVEPEGRKSLVEPKKVEGQGVAGGLEVRG